MITPSFATVVTLLCALSFSYQAYTSFQEQSFLVTIDHSTQLVEWQGVDGQRYYDQYYTLVGGVTGKAQCCGCTAKDVPKRHYRTGQEVWATLQYKSVLPLLSVDRPIPPNTAMLGGLALIVLCLTAFHYSRDLAKAQRRAIKASMASGQFNTA
jgi:hypothetical protein